MEDKLRKLYTDNKDLIHSDFFFLFMYTVYTF